MSSTNIRITEAHIRDGVKGSECDCPIALALRDTLFTDAVRVNGEGIFVNNRKFNMDKEDLRFMERFDNGQRVKPYSFRLIRTAR